MCTCRDKNIKNNITTTKNLNVYIPCSPSTIQVWFCVSGYAMLAVGIVQNSCINPNVLKSSYQFVHSHGMKRPMPTRAHSHVIKKKNKWLRVKGPLIIYFKLNLKCFLVIASQLQRIPNMCIKVFFEIHIFLFFFLLIQYKVMDVPNHHQYGNVPSNDLTLAL